MNRLVRPVLFTFEADVCQLFANLVFGASGAVTLSQGPYPGRFSKGFCAATLNTITTTATTNTNTSVTAAVSLVGVYNGMTVTGAGIPASTTVSAVNSNAGTFTLSNAATASATVPLTFSGGQYLIQLGSQAGVRLDTYNHLLGLSHIWDENTLNVVTAAAPAAPKAPAMFIVKSNVSVRTVPQSGNSANTDASFTIQFGIFTGAAFTAAVPASGEICKLTLALTRSGAI